MCFSRSLLIIDSQGNGAEIVGGIGGLHAGALTSSGHCLILLSCDLRVLQNFAGS